jgi:predicted Zn-dependent protease
MSDVQTEVQFGRQLAARILGNYPLWNNSKANQYVNLVGKAISVFSGRGELAFAFGILDTDEINAFAAPGGYIFITRGALMQMTDESQLAAVLGHEIAHVMKRHMIRELNLQAEQGSALESMAQFIGGATGGVRRTLEGSLDEAVNFLFHYGYQLEDELEADRIGVLMASAAGYDSNGLGFFLQKVKRFEAEPRISQDVKIKKDHPVLADRLAAIDRTIIEYDLHSQSAMKVKERFYEMVSH